MKTALAASVLILFMSASVFAQEGKARHPTSSDKCPVCGMFVAKYPDFLAQIIFKDGSVVFFDGVKDMFKYYFNMGKYDPSRSQADVAAVFVTDYYSLQPIDGTMAYYVRGSNVYGPMGKELIPLGSEEEASEFMFDHVGKEVVLFKAVTPEMIKDLD